MFAGENRGLRSLARFATQSSEVVFTVTMIPAVVIDVSLASVRRVAAVGSWTYDTCVVVAVWTGCNHTTAKYRSAFIGLDNKI